MYKNILAAAVLIGGISSASGMMRIKPKSGKKISDIKMVCYGLNFLKHKQHVLDANNFVEKFKDMGRKEGTSNKSMSDLVEETIQNGLTESLYLFNLPKDQQDQLILDFKHDMKKNGQQYFWDRLKYNITFFADHYSSKKSLEFIKKYKNICGCKEMCCCKRRFNKCVVDFKDKFSTFLETMKLGEHSLSPLEITALYRKSEIELIDAYNDYEDVLLPKDGEEEVRETCYPSTL